MKRLIGHVAAIEQCVVKGQPYAKANKERKIRAELRNTRITLENPLWADVWSVFKVWFWKKM